MRLIDLIGLGADSVKSGGKRNFQIAEQCRVSFSEWERRGRRRGRSRGGRRRRKE